MKVDPELFRKNLLKFTRIAFQLLPEIDKPSVLDVGCGTGIPTMELAELCNGKIIGVDRDRKALDTLEAKIQEKKLSHRMSTLYCSIEDLPFEKEKFDIIWAEGSISHLGFTGAVKLLRGYLKVGRFLVVHDDAGDPIDKITSAESEGYALYGFFIVSETVWAREYYEHLEAAITDAESSLPPFDLSCLKRELEQFKKSPGSFRSAFFILKKT